jgi:HEPN domain-containing protein
MRDDDRTTPLGLFNYARSYWQSGVLLHDARAKVTHPDAPVTLLLAHAIELYLKAFLRLRGVGIDEVKNSFGHDFKKLVDEASSRGLSLVEADMDIAAILTEKESIRGSRYIETGYYQRPGLAALSRTCRGLDQSVSATLRDAGMTIQSTELNHIEAD